MANFLFAPGAGAASTHPWMQRWKARLSALGRVQTFDYDYMREGRKRPDRLPELIAAHRAALHEFKQTSADPIFLAGKSMGGRVGCHLALEENVSGVICFGYPLCGMGDHTKMRDAVLRSLAIPILFIQGTRDALCPPELLEKVRAQTSALNFLHVVDGGDHSLQVMKTKLCADNETQDDVDGRIFDAIEKFVGERVG